MSLSQELQNIGLSDKEAKIYLAATELTEAPVQKIAEKAGVNRATAYFVIESLMKKGLISTFDKGKKTYYVAARPEALENIFKIKETEIKQQKNNLAALMPELKSLYNRDGNKPVIRFFEGKQGLINSSEELMAEYKDTAETARMLYSRDLLLNHFDENEAQQHSKYRQAKQIKSKVLYTYKKGEQPNTGRLGERIKLNEEKYPVTADMAIYKDTVRIATLGDKLSTVLIKDKDIATTLKSLFELAWKGAQAEK